MQTKMSDQMSQLSTEILNNVIIFYDGSKLWLNNKQFEEVFLWWTDRSDRKMAINQNVFSKNSISKILTREEFYVEYPQHKPEPYLPKVATMIFQNPKKVVGKKGVKDLLKGLNWYIAESQTKNLVVLELQKRMERAIQI